MIKGRESEKGISGRKNYGEVNRTWGHLGEEICGREIQATRNEREIEGFTEGREGIETGQEEQKNWRREGNRKRKGDSSGMGMGLEMEMYSFDYPNGYQNK
ncbi:hypothetical protein ACH5RR_031406 [Cinchona calisaya]|uniref:Uncharacterized protein n=1 Tax=Cinchona calisaya TaxID=153742 RepID=A0ABD2YF60_9GENT